MKKALALLAAALFTGGIIFTGTEGMVAATEGEASEEMIQEEYIDMEDMEDMEGEFEDEGMYEDSVEDQNYQDDEEREYLDETYEEDRG